VLVYLGNRIAEPVDAPDNGLHLEERCAERNDPRYVVVTAGEAGAVICHAQDDIRREPVLDAVAGKGTRNGRREFRNMTIPRSILVSAAALALSLSNGCAAPCPSGDALGARLAVGPSAPQSIAAQMHRQPTPASVAAARTRVRIGARVLVHVASPALPSATGHRR
jgi:hypothetical protein